LADPGRYRLPLEPDHGNTGHARPPEPRNHDREPTEETWLASRRRPLRPAHAPAHRPRRQGRSVPHEYHGGDHPPRAGILGVRPDASAISGGRYQALIDRLHT